MEDESKTRKSNQEVAAEFIETQAEVIAPHGAREKILKVAGQLFAQQGLEGVSTREIATQAELNVSLISYYFGGKEGLYKAVIHEFAVRMRNEALGFIEQFSDEKMDAKTFMAKLTQGLIATAKLKIAQRHVSVILQREMLSGLPYAKEIHDNVFGQLAEEAIEIFQKAKRKGIIRKEVNSQILFMTLIFSIENYVLQRQMDDQFWLSCGKLSTDEEEFVTQLVKIIFEGALK